MLTVLGLTAGTYAVASYILLRNPGLVHQRKSIRFPKCVHISHRGGAAEATENTLAAFDKAIKNTKTDMLEIDVQMTKDGVVVVAHDPHLRRVSDMDSLISEVEYSKLPRIKPKLSLDFDPGHFYVRQSEDDDDESTIPTLAQVFQAFPDVAINVDIKTHNLDLVSKVGDLISKYKREDKTVWGNIKVETTEACYQTNPSIGLFFSFNRVMALLALYYTGLLPFVPLKETHLEIPMPSIMTRHELKQLGPAKNLIVTLMDKILMRKKLFEHLRLRGIPVYVWVLNNEADFRKAFECGVSGVMTDYPTKLRTFLQAHPEYVNR